MHKPYRCHCVDWEFDDSLSGQLALWPSTKTVTRSLKGSAILMVFVGIIVLAFGFPPGCRTVSSEHRKLAQMEQQLEQAQRHAKRVATGATANEPGSVGSQVAQQARATAECLGREVEQQRTRAENARPTLGPVGDTLYWFAVSGLTLLAVAVPFIARRERIALDLDADGHTLRVKRRGQVLPSRTFDTRHYVGLAVVVQRIITRGEHGRTYDHGWRWSVVMVSPDPGTPWLELAIDEDTILPQPFTKLTTRVRKGLRYFEQATHLPTAPPVKIDVGESWSGLLRSFETRVEQGTEPAISDSPYTPL
ncbi:hypothetical protein [Algisphaera agarilytica]|uniref:Uncharacterized protein n=1 Tax=Algisphaera agarilytica TaxID=1385975 RepID=A0A7X0H3Z2_9BACT|nr:hypothetical protein [Algisphaera agarilytica]MBB6428862.1 hypothetical protein [Algisphaera agarilytica]